MQSTRVSCFPMRRREKRYAYKGQLYEPSMPFFVKAFWHRVGKAAKGKQQYAMLFSYAEKGKKVRIQGTTRGALLKSKILKA